MPQGTASLRRGTQGSQPTQSMAGPPPPRSTAGLRGRKGRGPMSSMVWTAGLDPVVQDARKAPKRPRSNDTCSGPHATKLTAETRGQLTAGPKDVATWSPGHAGMPLAEGASQNLGSGSGFSGWTQCSRQGPSRQEGQCGLRRCGPASPRRSSSAHSDFSPGTLLLQSCGK